MARSSLFLAVVALLYAVILEAMLYPAIRFFPRFEEHFETLRLLAGITSLQGIMTEIEAGGVVAYVVGQHFFKGCNTLGTAAAILFACGAVAGEVHRGTFELWLARPYTRTRLLTERFVAGALAVTVPVFLTSATIPSLCAGIGEDVPLGAMMRCAAHESAFLLAVYALTFLLSATSSSPLRVAICMLFATTFSFAVYMVEVVTHWSIYRWADIEVFVRIAEGEKLLSGRLWTLLALATALYGASLAAIASRNP